MQYNKKPHTFDTKRNPPQLSTNTPIPNDAMGLGVSYPQGLMESQKGGSVSGVPPMPPQRVSSGNVRPPQKMPPSTVNNSIYGLAGLTGNPEDVKKAGKILQQIQQMQSQTRPQSSRSNRTPNSVGDNHIVNPAKQMGVSPFNSSFQGMMQNNRK